MSLLTILITTQNRLNTLKDCISAINNSSGIKRVNEIIIVDDCSNDDTQSYLNGYANLNSKYRYIRLDKAKGPAFARNRGIEKAKGKYTLIMGDDVILFKDTLTIFCDYLEKYKPHNVSVLGNILPYPENITPFEYWSCNGGSQFGHYKISDENKFNSGEEYFYTSNIIVPTNMLREHPFDESFPFARYEDRELSYRLNRKINHKIHYLKDAKSYHKHKLPFYHWLNNFEKFTWSALHFSDIYPNDKELKKILGIDRAINISFFNSKILRDSVELLNNYNKEYFTNSQYLYKNWVQNIVNNNFRVLQEFFRINYYRKHLQLLENNDPDTGEDASQMMDLIIEKIDKSV